MQVYCDMSTDGGGWLVSFICCGVQSLWSSEVYLNNFVLMQYLNRLQNTKVLVSMLNTDAQADLN